VTRSQLMAELRRIATDLESSAQLPPRDYVAAPAGQAARTAVDAAATDLSSFEQAALRGDAADTTPDQKPTRLRAVDES
jgi:hypothetical protein